MKRLHVNVSVEDITASVAFYTALFDAEPSVRKDDYARWMLEDPRVNFAITTHGRKDGIDHLGIQVEDEAELDEVYGRLKRAGAPMIEQGAATCCYARSEKNWVFDPGGLAWETFLTLGDSPVYGADELDLGQTAGACCAGPETADASPLDEPGSPSGCCG